MEGSKLFSLTSPNGFSQLITEPAHVQANSSSCIQNYVPNKYIAIDDKDPVWMNETIKSKIKTKNKLYKQYIDNGRFESDFVFIETLITEINDLITSTKDLYY